MNELVSGAPITEDHFIALPPILPSFWIPTKEQILELKVGDCVKLIFRSRYLRKQKVASGERMWVEITIIDSEQHDISFWHGKLDSIPTIIEGLNLGDDITFHPLQIIGINKK